MNYKSDHNFHIPVMGLAFTVDSPVKVARFGISSVVSIIEDRLIEMMRRHYYPSINKVYEPITTQDPDYRAKRITDYLNLLNTIVQEQMQRIKSEAFAYGSEITKYFEMLPLESRLRKLYFEMLHCMDEKEKINKQEYLRSQLVAGSIDVNILTKADRETRDTSGQLIPDGTEAVSALRGYIKSDLTNSSIVFSAGLNPRLYSYLENYDAFDPDENFNVKKKVIIKVSDYRSALIQGKFLAKKGIWVSEFRIESGLNCGGHAFATDGYLMGPILEEFKQKRKELSDTIFEIYKPAIKNKLGFDFQSYPPIELSVQGGIGTYEEDKFLHEYYNVDSTGWGTPFLLVPEATTVDKETLNQLAAAKEKDVILSNYSPLGVRFHYLKGTSSDVKKEERIAKGKPGSPCTEKHLAFNTEFTEEAICTASHQYQKLKLAQLASLGLSEDELERQSAEVTAKDCLCVGLSNSASIEYNELFLKNRKAVNICPGPNIVNFSQIVSLQTMTDHIYGRTDIITNPNRPHMFIAEMRIYITYLKEQLLKDALKAMDSKRKLYYQSYLKNMRDAINYYHSIPENSIQQRDVFESELAQTISSLNDIENTYELKLEKPILIAI